jgi:hypothetical protein
MIPLVLRMHEAVKVGRNRPPRGDAEIDQSAYGGIFHKTPRKLITSRPGDTVVHGEKSGLNFLYTKPGQRFA